QGQLEELQRSIAETQWRIEDYEKRSHALGAASQPADAVDAAIASSQPVVASNTFEDDAEWRRLNAEVRKARADLERERGNRGDKHPAGMAVKSNLKLAEEAQAERERQWLRHPASTVAVTAPTGGDMPVGIDALKNTYAMQIFRRNLLVEDIAKQIKTL